MKRLSEMSDAFRKASDTQELKNRREVYDRNNSPTLGAEGENGGDFVSIEQKLELSEILYYRILEKIITLEKKRLSAADKDMTVIC